MVTSTPLILLVAAASTIAFTPPDFVDVQDYLMNEEIAEDAAYQDRLPREISEAAKPSGSSNLQSASSSASFASSGSFSGSGASVGAGYIPGNGFGTNSDAGSVDPSFFPGYYGVPASYPFQSFNKQRPYYMPYNFYSLFEQFFRQLQLMAQQNAYAANYYNPGIESNTVDYGTGQKFDNSGAGGYGNSDGSSNGGSGYAPPAFFGFPHGGGGASSSSFSGSGSSFGGFGGSSNFAGAGENPAVPAGNIGVGSGSSPSAPTADVVGAAAVAGLSPQGGFGYADVFPDLSNRFGAVGGEFPKPSGNTYGVFTSSSSGSSDVNGKKTSFKTATTGINDNGKITVFTKHDP